MNNNISSQNDRVDSTMFVVICFCAQFADLTQVLISIVKLYVKVFVVDSKDLVRCFFLKQYVLRLYSVDINIRNPLISHL